MIKSLNYQAPAFNMQIKSQINFFKFRIVNINTGYTDGIGIRKYRSDKTVGEISPWWSNPTLIISICHY